MHRTGPISRFGKFFVMAALALSMSRAAAALAADSVKFNVGLADPVNTVLAMWVAQDAGLYAKYGLAVHFVDMNGGSRGAAALRTGELDVMHVGLSSVVKLNREGDDLRVIGSLSNVIRFTFFSAPNITSAVALKGGQVGISSAGSESDSTVTLALQRLGLSRSDVKIVEYGGGSHRLAGVKSGEISATALNEPFASLARDQGVHVLVDLVPEQIPWLFSGITVQHSAIGAKQDQLKRFLEATMEGNAIALTNEKQAKDVLAKELKISDPKILDISYNDFRQQSPEDLMPSTEGAKNILAQFPGGSTKVEDYVDTSLLEALNKEGFLQGIRKKYSLP
jgi:ABC-type nitrate/sulfonate/bicarbonate transport system substrate-binding protein